jgi:chitodextrinase
MGPSRTPRGWIVAILSSVAVRTASAARKRVSVGVAFALVGVGVLATPLTAAAAPIVCSTPALVAAISAANTQLGGGTVTLPAGCVYTLTAADNATDGGTGLPVITGIVTIAGSGATITRSAAAGTPSFRIFDVASAGKLTLDSVTLSNGLVNDGISGGGAIDSHGTLTITASTFAGNSSPATTGTSGGAVNSSGRLTVRTSTFTGNIAQEGGGVFSQNTATISRSIFTNNTATIYGGGAILNAFGTMTLSTSTFVGNTGPGGGAIDNDATVNITNSTFYNNTGGSNGGGAIQNFGSTNITYSTLSGNTSQFGANIHNFGTFTVTVGSSIVANGVSGSNCSGPPFVDNGYNLDTGSSCGFSSAAHSISNTQPQLEALASNGGGTQTMALPVKSAAVDAIPASVTGCTGSVDQRGIARPQGAGCDIGAFEVIVASGDTLPPTTPTGLTAPSVTANSVSLQWSRSFDDTAVTGYTVYRNGTAVGGTGAATVTTFADVTPAPATVYSYTVDAFDGAGLHSPQSKPLAVTTLAPTGIQGTQGQAVTTSARVTNTTIPLTGAVHTGDLLVGWFGQFDSSGQVQVSDNLNGAWTRSASTKFSSGTGDLALYYVQNSAGSPYGLTVTIASTTATFLEGAASDYSGVAREGALDQAVTGAGISTAVDSGPTAAVGAGELVVGGILTGGSPGTTTPGASQGQPFTMRALTVSGSAGLEDVLSSVAGTQDARATLSMATDWYAMGAVFHQYGTGDTQPPTTPTGLTQTSVFSDTASFSWNASTDNAGVASYTVYRNGSAIGAPLTTSYTDSTVAPSTTYSFTVDAVDIAGNHSPQSLPLSITTPAAPPPSARWVQGGVAGTGTKVVSASLTLSSAVRAGDLLVGWFGQFDASGQVQVSDNVNGPWTRSAASTKYGAGSGSGDIAMFYVQNAAAAAGGLTVTISAAAATFLQGSAADYTNMSQTNSLDQFAVASGTGTAADSGPTASVGVGDLLFSGFMTGSSPGGIVANGGLVIHDRNVSGSLADADAFVTTGGPQHASWTLQNSADWYVVAAIFHTIAAIFPPTNVTATAASSTQVNVSWSAGGGTASTFTVYRNGSSLATVPGSSLSYSDATASPTTTYSYAVDAVDAGGNHSPKSSAATVTTPADTTPPTAPGGLAATASSVTQVSLAWSASTDNVGVTGYTVYRNGTKVGATAGNTLTYADGGLAPATTYTYTVDAFDAAGNHSATSASSSATTPADTTPPSAPANVTASPTSPTQVNVSWTASTDDVAVTGYTVYRNGTQVAVTAGNTLTFNDTGLSPSTAYTYTVDAFDASSNHSALSSPATATTPATTGTPTAPSNPSATAVSATQINITWSASTGPAGVSGYTIYRNGAQLATVAASSLIYSDTGLAPTTSYSYAVDAFDGSGVHSPQSATVTATTLADTTPPSVPANLTATAPSATNVNLGWSSSTDNVGVTGYTVYRGGTVLATVGASTLTYSDAAVTPATTYTYSVDSFDAAGNHSAQSATASVRVPAVPKFVQSAVVSTGTTVTSVTLTLGPVARGDLIVGSFGQYNSTGQVTVSDSVNGAWTRSASMTWHGGTAPGDIALYYFANSAAAPGGLTITIASTTATYLQGGAAEYSGVATVNPLDQAVIATGSSTAADSGLTPAVGTGELVYGGMTASNGPGTLTAGASQGVAFTKRAQNTSGSQGAEDITSSAPGQQHAVFTFPTSTQWFAVCAVFRPA